MSIKPSLDSVWLPGQRDFLWKDWAPSAGVFWARGTLGTQELSQPSSVTSTKPLWPFRWTSSHPSLWPGGQGEVSSSPRGFCCHILSVRKVMLRLTKHSQRRWETPSHLSAEWGGTWRGNYWGQGSFWTKFICEELQLSPLVQCLWVFFLGF